VNSLTAFPSLYPILDSSFLPPAGDERESALEDIVRNLAEAGVGVLQFRNKQGSEDEILADALTMRRASAGKMKLILNDWPQLAVRADFDGVHVGQTDMSPGIAREIVGTERMIGISTHNETQLRAADRQPVDYIAIGPVFATSSKAKPDPIVGLEGVALARRITRKPLVAIGGITLENATQVLIAGADSVAVISAIFSPAANPVDAALEFMRRMR
jgi:thiamine-phosphate pyrophosphorylase